jgi:hypothetical protein
MNIIYIVLTTLMIITTSALACGGGEEVKLNDDTILKSDGLYYPISDPEYKRPVLAEAVMKKYFECRLEKVGRYTPNICNKRYRMKDSQGTVTHKVEMDVEGTSATYIVTDVATGTVTTYKAELHTRGGCGLEEVENNSTTKGQ